MLENFCSKFDFKKIFEKIFFLFFTIILSSLLFSQIATGKATIFGFKPFYIMSPSMEPTIHTHQIVISVPIDPDDVEIGDIISYDLFYNNNKLLKKTIIHRVVDITDEGFIFKGDNNDYPDKYPIPKERIGYKIILY